jgi:energy-coupling factor transporter ATP-binding protein EcfA2
VVASTHSREFAAGLGGRCVVLDRGRIAFDGDVDAALADAALLERTGLAWRRRVVRGAHSA